MSGSPAVYTDLKIYYPEFNDGMYEVESQASEAFNAASNGAIQLTAVSRKGHYAKDAFFKNISSLITRRDISSTSAANILKPTQDEFVSVKLNAKIGPVDTAIDALKKIASDQRELSFILGQQVAKAKMLYKVNRAIMAAEAALSQSASYYYNYGGTGTITHSTLVSTANLLGDRSGAIVCYVMHSKVYHDLMKQAISDKITNVADTVIYGGSPGTFGKPVVVTDCSSLYDANGSATDTYNTLCLVDSAVSVEDSEQDTMVTEIVTGLENLVFRYQGEFAFNVGVKGFQWDITHGGANPDDTALGTYTNWDFVATSVKDGPGAKLITQ